MAARLFAMLVAMAIVLPGLKTAEADTVRDQSYQDGRVSGKWRHVRIGDTVLGRTEARVFADWAAVLRRESDFSELLSGGRTMMMYDQTFPPYLLVRLGIGDMKETVLASYSGELEHLSDDLADVTFLSASSTMGTLHYARFDPGSDDCVTFVQQWPAVTRHVDRMARRLLGVVCESDVDTDGRDIVTHVTSELVPRIVDQLR